MKVLREPRELAEELARLFAAHAECRFALAVAPDETLRRLLSSYSNRLVQLVVGSDFVKAHPLHLGEWSRDPRVRVVPPRASGSFHPMLHLFSDPGYRRWSCLIARPNVGGSAFELLGDPLDDEAVVMVNEQDDPAGWECERLRKSVDRYWALGGPPDESTSSEVKTHAPRA